MVQKNLSEPFGQPSTYRLDYSPVLVVCCLLEIALCVNSEFPENTDYLLYFFPGQLSI